MLLFFIISILFSQEKVLENTSNISYILNDNGVIAYDSLKGNFRYPKNNGDNFFYSISHIFSGINAKNGDTIYSSNFKLYNENVNKGLPNSTDFDKYIIYESKYYDKTTGKSLIGEYNYPLFTTDSKLPGQYIDDNSKRNLSYFVKPFIQSDNDIFTIYNQKIGDGSLIYQLRTLNYRNKDYTIIEIKIINNTNTDLVDCYFSPLLDPDISRVSYEYIDSKDNNGELIGDKLIFYTSNSDTKINAYAGFEYLQKSYQIDGNYIFKPENQFQNVNFNLMNSNSFYNSNSIYELLKSQNPEIKNSDIKAFASVGPFDFNNGDTCVFTYTIAYAKSKSNENLENVENMDKIISLLDEVYDKYYNEIFDFALSVPLEFQNEEIIAYDLENFIFCKKNQLKSGKYLILIKKENKFVLTKKIIVE